MHREASPLFADAAAVAGTAARSALLIVDDGSRAIEAVAATLEGDFPTLAHSSRAEAVRRLREMETPPGLALIDVGPSPASHRSDEGLRLIGELLAHVPDMKIFAWADGDDEARAGRARASGTVEVFARSAEPARIRQMLRDVLRFQSAEATDDTLIGASVPMRKLRRQIEHHAGLASPLLIEGEAGSDRMRVARALHAGSARRGEPLWVLRCTQPDAAGVIDAAAEGSLCLDEVSMLPLESQVRLLRRIEQDEAAPGARCARIIAATSRDLREAVRGGRFLRELHGCLSTFTVGVPPVRELDGDTALLLDHYRGLYAAAAGLAPFRLDPAAAAQWRAYAFPGDLRELRHVAMRLAAKYPGLEVTAAQLAAELDAPPRTDAQDGALSLEPDRLIEEAQRHLERERRFDLDRVLGAWEQGYIAAAMKLTAGNVSRAAKLLGLNRTTLYSRLESHRKPG